MKRNFIYIIGTLLVVLAVLLTGCASGAPAPGEPSTGKLEIIVTDAPTDDVTAVLVTLKGIEVHLAGSEPTPTPTGESSEGTQEPEAEDDDSNGWITIGNVSTQQFDLFEVREHPLTLTTDTPPVGNYTQVRMEVDTIIVEFNDDEEQRYPAEVPSGKIKFIQPFKVSDLSITQLTFDFDAARSVNVTGQGTEKIIFKPVIKLSVNEKPETSNQNQENNREQNSNQEALQITTTELPSGVINAPYSENIKLAAEGGKKPYGWSISSGALPAGMVLSPNSGVISGTPTAAGDFSITVMVTDKSKPEAETASQILTLHIAASG
jgi:hypothetical protein